MPDDAPRLDPATFIAEASASGGAERANAQKFLDGLADVLGVDRPDYTTGDPRADGYTYERPLDFSDGTQNKGFIDLYRRGSFVFETKQGADAKRTADGRKLRQGHGKRGTRAWEQTMDAARRQASGYARNLEAAEPAPPFLIVSDVGYCFDLYADFSGTGRLYKPFPDPDRYRVFLPQLESQETRDLFRAIYLDPYSLDPTRRQARVTVELAKTLAGLATELDGATDADGNAMDAEARAGFLSRALFSMFAEDAGLIPEGAFTRLLDAYASDLDALPLALGAFFETMDRGGYVGEVRAKLRRFNGTLFKDARAPVLSRDAYDRLTEAAHADWKNVEPSIFGTLIERALDKDERHALGAHFTPRAYVERLVGPAILEPLRAEWESTWAAASTLAADAEAASAKATRTRKRNEAIATLRAFFARLASVRVLDPACGSGNFLYVTLAGLKELESEARAAAERLVGESIGEGFGVTPLQMRGLEVNARAAAIADLVLWIGYLQYNRARYGEAQPLPEPVLDGYGQVEHRDAVLSEDGTPAPWPEAEFIVGNPPFIGASRMRDALGDDTTEALRAAYPEVPESADFVMYWWERAAGAVARGEAERFGLITTNSITQTFNRRVVEARIGSGADGLALAFAVPDHPWVDGADGADVRVAMTVGVSSEAFEHENGRLAVVTDEGEKSDAFREVDVTEYAGAINPDLTVGPDVTEAEQLEANADLSNRGVQLFGQGFVVTPDEAAQLGLGRINGLETHLRPILNGRDLTQTPRGVLVIDFFGLEAEEARQKFPEAYEHVLREVKPARDKNRRKVRRDNWWLFGEPNPKLRLQLAGLKRYIVTPYVAKHRLFQFLPDEIIPDDGLVAIALDDAYSLGVVSSSVHVEWALRAGGRLGVGNDPRYNKSKCFEPFPFPEAPEADRAAIAEIAEALDAHRKARQRETGVTLTNLYNAVDALRAGRDLTAKEQQAADDGLAHTVLDLHRRLDRAVLSAYGWSDLDAEAGTFRAAVLERLVDLNRQRRAEERAGVVKYLRPEFQNPTAEGQSGLALVTPPEPKPEPPRRPWPSELSRQLAAVREAVEAGAETPEAVRARFTAAPVEAVRQSLDALAALGIVRQSGDRLTA
ncbi:MAG: DNA methyltransferase [Bacteroidota bacterium]